MQTLAKKPQGSWVAVPIPVSNPTIGTGLQATLLYLHPKISSAPNVPNATSGVMGMYTDTESWFVGGFHDGNWSDDRYRFSVFGGTNEFDLDYFGTGEDIPRQLQESRLAARKSRMESNRAQQCRVCEELVSVSS